MLSAYKKSWLDSFNYKGRMSREVWNKVVGVHVMIAFVPVLICVLLDSETLGMIWSPVALVSLFPVVSCLVRRLHDIGKSGWWLLLDLILAPVFIGGVLFVLQMKKESVPANKWGSPEGEEETLSAGSFVDERLTEADLKNENKKLFLIILKILGILAIISLVIWLLSEISMLVAPLI